jgi:hypothetical protein
LLELMNKILLVFSLDTAFKGTMHDVSKKINFKVCECPKPFCFISLGAVSSFSLFITKPHFLGFVRFVAPTTIANNEPSCPSRPHSHRPSAVLAWLFCLAETPFSLVLIRPFAVQNTTCTNKSKFARSYKHIHIKSRLTRTDADKKIRSRNPRGIRISR